MTPIEMAMWGLSALAVLVVLLLPVAIIVMLSLLIDARQRGRDRVLARQIRLTDAVHAELGATVSPVVEKRAFRPWRVVFSMPAERSADVSRLVSITDRVLADDPPAPGNLQIVFTSPAPALRTRAA